MRPLAIDLYCGLGGWAEGLLAEGWNVVRQALQTAQVNTRYIATFKVDKRTEEVEAK